MCSTLVDRWRWANGKKNNRFESASAQINFGKRQSAIYEMCKSLSGKKVNLIIHLRSTTSVGCSSSKHQSESVWIFIFLTTNDILLAAARCLFSLFIESRDRQTSNWMNHFPAKQWIPSEIQSFDCFSQKTNSVSIQLLFFPCHRTSYNGTNYQQIESKMWINLFQFS